MSLADALPSIHDILASNRLCTHFQPIISARQKSIVGLEALSRGIAGIEAMSLGGILENGKFIPPDVLFKLARQEGLEDKLKQLCQENAVRSFAALQNRPDGLVLFINFDPSAVIDDDTAADERRRRRVRKRSRRVVGTRCRPVAGILSQPASGTGKF
jgi:EAL domain-containing protein (putative c-di-GMP-specific phosphodiesterase class I)